jgi:hypothetical protein
MLHLPGQRKRLAVHEPMAPALLNEVFQGCQRRVVRVTLPEGGVGAPHPPPLLHCLDVPYQRRLQDDEAGHEPLSDSSALLGKDMTITADPSKRSSTPPINLARSQ